MSDTVAAAPTAHELLLALAGWVDDDLLATGRELVAVGEEVPALELLVASLAAARTALPSPVRGALVDAAVALRVEPHADRALPPGLPPGDTAHRFAAEAGPADVAVRVAGIGTNLPVVARSGARVSLVWRLTPAGATPGPLPHPVLLAAVQSGGPVEVLAYQLGAALARAGVPASVEAFVDGTTLPPYHLAALSEAVALDPAADDAVSPPPAAPSGLPSAPESGVSPDGPVAAPAVGMIPVRGLVPPAPRPRTGPEAPDGPSSARPAAVPPAAVPPAAVPPTAVSPDGVERSGVVDGAARADAQVPGPGADPTEELLTHRTVPVNGQHGSPGGRSGPAGFRGDTRGPFPDAGRRDVTDTDPGTTTGPAPVSGPSGSPSGPAPGAGPFDDGRAHAPDLGASVHPVAPPRPGDGARPGIYAVPADAVPRPGVDTTPPVDGYPAPRPAPRRIAPVPNDPEWFAGPPPEQGGDDVRGGGTGPGIGAAQDVGPAHDSGPAHDVGSGQDVGAAQDVGADRDAGPGPLGNGAPTPASGVDVVGGPRPLPSTGPITLPPPGDALSGPLDRPLHDPRPDRADDVLGTGTDDRGYDREEAGPSQAGPSAGGARPGEDTWDHDWATGAWSTSDPDIEPVTGPTPTAGSLDVSPDRADGARPRLHSVSGPPILRAPVPPGSGPVRPTPAPRAQGPGPEISGSPTSGLPVPDATGAVSPTAPPEAVSPSRPRHRLDSPDAGPVDESGPATGPTVAPADDGPAAPIDVPDGSSYTPAEQRPDHSPAPSVAPLTGDRDTVARALHPAAQDPPAQDPPAVDPSAQDPSLLPDGSGNGNGRRPMPRPSRGGDRRPAPGQDLGGRLTPNEQELLRRLQEELAARENGSSEHGPRNGSAHPDAGPAAG